MIPRERIILYAALAALFPTLLVALYLWSRYDQIQILQQRTEELSQRWLERRSKQAVNEAAIIHYRDADKFYLSKQIEPLQLLQGEVEALKKILDNKQFAEDKGLRRRLDQLTGPENALSFNEGAVVRYPLFKEIIETQAHPVELDVKDIEAFLRLVEGVPWGEIPPPEGRPQLIILDFRLDKKRLPDDNQVYVMNTRLLKREYL